MTAEMDRAAERLRPRILETEETGRLELNPPPAPPTDLPAPRTRRSRSPARVAATGLGILVLGLIGIDLIQFIDGAFAHGTGLGIAATVAVAAGCGGAAYWLVAELRGLWRLRSAERLRSLIPFALTDELKAEIDAAAAILAADPLLRQAVARYRAVREPHHSGRDALELFSRFVLAPADRLAKAAIRQWADTRGGQAQAALFLVSNRTEAIIAQIERFAPGFRDRITGFTVRSTTQMDAYNPNYVGGDIMTGAKDIRQLTFGPRITLSPYCIGLRGSYICSAATPPGPGAHGMCGANAAQLALGYLARRT